MYNIIQRYVSSCYTYRQAKALYKTYNGFLKPLPVPDRRWKDILINFVIDLPKSKGCINIMVVIDQLFKIRHLIACPNILAPTVAQLFLDYVWKLYRLLKTIVSNRGRQFVLVFWKELTTQLYIKALLSMAYYPEMDG